MKNFFKKLLAQMAALALQFAINSLEEKVSKKGTTPSK